MGWVAAVPERFRSLAPPVAGIDLGFDRHSGHQSISKTVRIVDDNLDGDALNSTIGIALCQKTESRRRESECCEMSRAGEIVECDIFTLPLRQNS
jgi:hypothetical protein